MRVLVTGASGFIGSYRTTYLSDSQNEVISIANTHRVTNGDIVYNVDISEKGCLDYIVARYRPDIIEHYASQSIVSVSRLNPYQTYKTNVLGTVNVCEVALKHKIPLIAFTTDKVYGDTEQADEDTIPVISAGSYETSKLLQDIVVQSYGKQGLNYKIIRSVNVYGPFDYNSRIIPNTLKSLADEKSPIIFDNVQGYREYIYIDDLMTAIDIIRDNKKYNIVNISSGELYSQEMVVKTIISIWNDIFKTSIVPQYKSSTITDEIPKQILLFKRLKDLGWSPKVKFQDGIRLIIQKQFANSKVMNVPGTTFISSNSYWYAKNNNTLNISNLPGSIWEIRNEF